MKIKTANLTGPALDWAVAKCEGFTPHQTCMYDTPTLWRNGHRYAPSTDWSQGGPIIEREGISITMLFQEWEALLDLNEGDGTVEVCRGPTPLIAAMRCFVASRLGDKVDIPEELT